jgi:mono/diheme cytochrome c family protein
MQTHSDPRDRLTWLALAAIPLAKRIDCGGERSARDAATRHDLRKEFSMRACTALLISVISGACMIGPMNGEVVTDSSVIGVSLAFSGHSGAPNDEIKIQVLNDPTLDPADPMNWTNIATTFTSTTADTSLQGTWYAWGTDAVVVDPNDLDSTEDRWPQGGLARLRAVRALNGQPLTTFDAITGGTCVGEHLAANETPQQIAAACQGLGKTNAAVVSTTPLPAATTFLTRKGVGDEFETAEYYVQIQAPPTIGEFLAKYHFPAVPIRARYYNDGDLGLGRDMNCWKDGSSTVCFVVNYDNRAPNVIGDPLSFDPALFGANYDPDFAGDPQHALAKLEGGFYHFATVAMVYTPPNGGNSNGPNAVKFIVYGADGNLAFAAKLDDKEENTSIPQNCLSCHGINATYDPVSNTATGGEFLPFDPFSFQYPTDDEQVDAFRQLNALVRAAGATRGVQNLIDGMYAPLGVNNPAAVANDDYVPAKWKTLPTGNAAPLDGTALYLGLVKPACRTCHVSANDARLDFVEYNDFLNYTLDSIDQNPLDQLQTIKAEVCGPAKAMPHAERVMKKFWESGARAYLVTGFPQDSSHNDCKP